MGLYDVLRRVQPSPIIELNRAIAVGMAHGFEAGLRLMNEIELPGYHLLPAARADLLRRLARYQEAAEQYRVALQLVKNDAERAFLQRRLLDLPPA